jgi:hypothetical protein
MKAVEMAVGRTSIKKARNVVVGIELLSACVSRRSRYAVLPRAFASFAMQTLNTPSILILSFPAPVLSTRQFSFGRSMRDDGNGSVLLFRSNLSKHIENGVWRG